MALPYLELVLAFIVGVSALDLYVDARQLKALKSPKPPAALAAEFTEEEYKKTQAYSIDKWWFGFWQGLFILSQTLVVLYFKLLPVLWNFSAYVLTEINIFPINEITNTVSFILCYSLIDTVIGIPWSLYSTFVLEEKHGFNKQTLSIFVTDIIKQILIALVFIPPVVGTMTYILQVAGPLVAIYMWGFLFVVTVLLMTIYPTLIAPLFNKYDALPEGSLRSKIEGLAGSLKFPLKKLYRVDGSKRSAHSNAYMYGFFNNKRIVLYDTLIDQCSEEQVVAVLAHELGHWKLRHTPVLFATGQAAMLSQFLLFTLVRNDNDLFAAFGFTSVRPVFISLVLFQFLYKPAEEVISFLSNIVSRLFEFQADGFAVKLGHAAELRTALLRLQSENKSAMNVDPLYSTFHYSHPPLVERLRAIDAAAKKKE